MADDPKKLVSRAKRAVALNAAGSARRMARPEPEPDAKTPPDLARAIAKNGRARLAFASFPPSHKREYAEWILEARRPETRKKRVPLAVAWMAHGRSRSWKHQ